MKVLFPYALCKLVDAYRALERSSCQCRPDALYFRMYYSGFVVEVNLGVLLRRVCERVFGVAGQHHPLRCKHYQGLGPGQAMVLDYQHTPRTHDMHRAHTWHTQSSTGAYLNFQCKRQRQERDSSLDSEHHDPRGTHQKPEGNRFSNTQCEKSFLQQPMQWLEMQTNSG